MIYIYVKYTSQSVSLDPGVCVCVCDVHTLLISEYTCMGLFHWVTHCKQCLEHTDGCDPWLGVKRQSVTVLMSAVTNFRWVSHTLPPTSSFNLNWSKIETCCHGGFSAAYHTRTSCFGPTTKHEYTSIGPHGAPLAKTPGVAWL